MDTFSEVYGYHKHVLMSIKPYHCGSRAYPTPRATYQTRTKTPTATKQKMKKRITTNTGGERSPRAVEKEYAPENPMRRRRRPLPEIQIPVPIIRRSRNYGSLMRCVIVLIGVGSDDPAVDPDSGPVDRVGGVVLDLDLHTPEPLPIAPL